MPDVRKLVLALFLFMLGFAITRVSCSGARADAPDRGAEATPERVR